MIEAKSAQKESRSSPLWLLIVVGTGGVLGLLSIADHNRVHLGMSGDQRFMIGALGLLVSPMFLGILVGLKRPARPLVTALVLSLSCLAGAMPILGEGVVCMIVYAPVAIITSPLAAAVTASIVKRRRRHLPNASGLEQLLLVFPIAGALGARLSPPSCPSPITLSDSAVVDAPPAAVWRSIDTLHLRFAWPTPVILRLGLPIPIELHGGGAHVGAERRVVFSNGVVLATVTQASAPRSFTVRLSVERGGREFFNHWAILGDSVFELDQTPDGRTRITHTTTYTPLSVPRWYFGPIESYLGRSIQRYMLEAYAQQIHEHPVPDEHKKPQPLVAAR